MAQNDARTNAQNDDAQPEVGTGKKLVLSKATLKNLSVRTGIKTGVPSDTSGLCGITYTCPRGGSYSSSCMG